MKYMFRGIAIGASCTSLVVAIAFAGFARWEGSTEGDGDVSITSKSVVDQMVFEKPILPLVDGTRGLQGKSLTPQP